MRSPPISLPVPLHLAAAALAVSGKPAQAAGRRALPARARALGCENGCEVFASLRPFRHLRQRRPFLPGVLRMLAFLLQGRGCRVLAWGSLTLAAATWGVSRL